jgi:hypothetical protein
MYPAALATENRQSGRARIIGRLSKDIEIPSSPSNPKSALAKTLTKGNALA